MPCIPVPMSLLTSSRHTRNRLSVVWVRMAFTFSRAHCYQSCSTQAGMGSHIHQGTLVQLAQPMCIPVLACPLRSTVDLHTHSAHVLRLPASFYNQQQVLHIGDRDRLAQSSLAVMRGGYTGHSKVQVTPCIASCQVCGKQS